MASTVVVLPTPLAAACALVAWASVPAAVAVVHGEGFEPPSLEELCLVLPSGFPVGPPLATQA